MPNGLAIAGGVTWPLLAPDGSAAAPSYSFASDPNTGMYSAGADALGFSAGGTLRLTVATAGITATVPVLAANGSAVAPAYSFSSDTDVGMYRISANTIALVGGGTAFLWNAQADSCPTSLAGWSMASFATGQPDLTLARLAAASLRQGLAPSATPVAQTFTVGEASRPGTDSNVGGASGIIRSGLGTGTGTGSLLYFQTPDLAVSGSGTQAYVTRLTLDRSAFISTVQVRAPDGTSTLPGLSFTTNPSTYGISYVAGNVCIIPGSASTFYVNGTSATFGNYGSNGYLVVNTNSSAGVVGHASGRLMAWSSSSVDGGSSQDLYLGRLGAASLRLGNIPSATPVAQVLTIGEASRPGTDLNIAGSNGTIRSGLGTGNAAGSSLFFLTPTAVGSSTVAQTYGQRLSLSALGATFDIPDQSFRINGQVSGAGASAGTLTNAPAAGNPNFWLPINCGGTVYYFPGW